MVPVRSPSSLSEAPPTKVIDVPAATVVVVGAVIVTVGLASTRTVTDRLAVRPAASVTDAVMVCVPVDRVLSAKLAPVPSAPSRLEVQWIAAPRSPSSAAGAVAVNVIAAPGARTEPAAGAASAGAGAASTRTGVEEWPVVPPPAVAGAVQ